MNRIRKHLSGHARPYATGIGMGVFLLGMLGTLALVARVQLQAIATSQAALVERLDAVAEEAGSLLDRLNEKYAPDCTTTHLVELRNLLFETRFLRDIGLLSEHGAVFCTTGFGRWERPYLPPPEKLHTLRLPDGRTRQFIFDMPTRVGGERLPATIAWQDRFNVVIDPFVLGDLYRRGAQMLWFLETDGSVTPVGPEKPQPPAALRTLLQRDALAATGQPQAYYAWREGTFVGTSLSLRSRIAAQTHTPLAHALHEQAPTLLMLLGFSALLGVLSGVVALQRLLHLGSLNARIRTLLDPTHLRCVYQPIVDIHTGRPVGCEVLMRIQDGAETLMPDTTIPAIMRGGLTWQLDASVMRQGLAELLTCTLPPGGFKVAFNLFPQNIRFAEIHALLAPLQHRIAEAGIQIDLEVTEYNYDRNVIAEVDQCRAAGYQVSVDDFGTGYSNLGSIKRIAPNYLKIDKSFVYDMEDASIRSSLIPEIVGIAHAIGAQLIAEGVENLRQVEQLRAHGVQYAQGYFYARPLPLSAFRQYLRDALPDKIPAENCTIDKKFT